MPWIYSEIDELSFLDPSPSHQTQVKPLLANVSVDNMKAYLTTLTAFNNRYYTSTTGVDATNWIVKTVGDVSTLNHGEEPASNIDLCRLRNNTQR